jgi:HSP20 family molecular chaperone IbpA
VFYSIMFKKKCPSCAKKIEKKFNYCPYCGVSFRKKSERENFGMLGRDDSFGKVQEELKLPFGMNKIVNSLIKQIEGQINNMNVSDDGIPRGISIRVATPSANLVQEHSKKKIDAPEISDDESERRSRLPRVDAKSKVKRLADTIIYELDVPGVKKKEDVVLTELATGLEIKAYSKTKCYVKFIPLKVEVVEHYVEKEKVVVEIKGY